MANVAFRFAFVKLTFHKAEDLKTKNTREYSSSSVKKVLVNFITLYGIYGQRGKEKDVEREQKKSIFQCFLYISFEKFKTSEKLVFLKCRILVRST